MKKYLKIACCFLFSLAGEGHLGASDATALDLGGLINFYDVYSNTTVSVRFNPFDTAKLVLGMMKEESEKPGNTLAIELDQALLKEIERVNTIFSSEQLRDKETPSGMKCYLIAGILINAWANVVAAHLDEAWLLEHRLDEEKEVIINMFKNRVDFLIPGHVELNLKKSLRASLYLDCIPPEERLSSEPSWADHHLGSYFTSYLRRSIKTKELAELLSIKTFS